MAEAIRRARVVGEGGPLYPGEVILLAVRLDLRRQGHQDPAFIVAFLHLQNQLATVRSRVSNHNVATGSNGKLKEFSSIFLNLIILWHL